MTTAVRLRVFGGLRLWRSGVEVDVGPIRQRIVLAVLLAARGTPVSTAELVDILWGEHPSASSVTQVQRLIGQVRRLFEPDLPHRAPGAWVHPAGQGYLLRIDGRASDLMAFFELAEAARAAVRQGDPRDAARKYEQALTVAAEEPFAGLPTLRDLPAVAALHAARAELAAEAAEQAADRPGPAGLLPLISRYAAAAPWHEPLQARLIRLLTAADRRAEALAHFEQVRQRLADDLGADPGIELRAAHLDALADPGDVPDPYRPAQLPPRVIGFAPRDDLVAALDAGRASAVIVLSGMGGAGKTALAVDWSHRVAADFPDGQLYLDLRGFDPGGRQLRPLDALNTLLEALGVDPSSAGRDLGARAARFRSALADRRMILLLDNARDSAQVRPLLPASPGCLVVVTSRNRLPGLVAHVGAWPVHVGRMNRAGSRDVLARRLGEPRLAAEPGAVDQLIRLCAGLPLALAMTAAQIAVSPESRLTDAVTGLTSTRRLDALGTGESQDDVRSAFSWSYAVLTEPAARLFRLLAVNPGTTVTAAAVASIAGADVRVPLNELCIASMVTRLGADRYVVHDLLHDYAAELLDANGDERAPAEHRLVEHYVQGTRNAYRTFGLPLPADPGPPPAGLDPPAPADDAAALDWYLGERAAVAAAVDLALDRGWARSAALLVLQIRPLRASAAEAQGDAVDQTLRVLGAVEKLGDPVLRIALLREASLGFRRSDPGRAARLLCEALAVAEQQNDLFWQAQVLRSLGGWPSIRPAAERRDLLRRAVAMARRADSTSALVYALEALAKDLIDDGLPAEAAPLAAEAFELAGPAGMHDFQVALATRRAEIALGGGDGATAVAMAEWAMTNAAPQDNHTLFNASSLLAKAYLEVGRLAPARSAANLFRELIRRHGDTFAGAYGAEAVDEMVAEVDRVVTVLGAASGTASAVQ